MNQTRIQSLIEAVFNVLIGFLINLTANMYVLPWFGFHPSIGQAFWIGVVFTAISIARSYTIRRFFNYRLQNAAHKLAGLAK